MIGSLQQHALPVAMVLLCAAAMYLVYRDMRNMEARIGKIDAALLQLFEEREQIFGVPADDAEDEHDEHDEQEGDAADFDFCQFEVAAADALEVAPAVAAEEVAAVAAEDVAADVEAAQDETDAPAEPEEEAPATKKTRAHKARAT